MEDPTSREIRIGVRELRGSLTRYLAQVRAGASILVTSRDVVVAEIKPPAVYTRPLRAPGALRGKIVMSADFDVMPDDILDAMER